MTSSVKTNIRKSLIRRVPWVMMTIGTMFAPKRADAQNDTLSTGAPQNQLSIEIVAQNMDYSFKNQANSILTWRDMNMLGFDVKYQSKRNWGGHIGASTTIGDGYSTDDDINNNVKGLTQHFTKAYRLELGGHKNIAKKEKVGIDVAYTYLNNCRGGDSFIAFDDTDKIIRIAESLKDGIVYTTIDQAQRYHAIQIKPFYEYDKKFFDNGKHAIDMSMTGMPGIHVGYGYWHQNKQFVNLSLELGGRVAIRWTSCDGSLYVQIFDEAAFSCLGLSAWHHSTNEQRNKSPYGVQYLKNTKNNILGIRIGISGPVRSKSR